MTIGHSTSLRWKCSLVLPNKGVLVSRSADGKNRECCADWAPVYFIWLKMVTEPWFPVSSKSRATTLRETTLSPSEPVITYRFMVRMVCLSHWRSWFILLTVTGSLRQSVDGMENKYGEVNRCWIHQWEVTIKCRTTTRIGINGNQHLEKNIDTFLC